MGRVRGVLEEARHAGRRREGGEKKKRGELTDRGTVTRGGEKKNIERRPDGSHIEF